MPINNFPIDVVGITIEADPTALKMDQNLSDLVDASAARTNLDVYDTGTVDTTLAGYLLLAGGSMTSGSTLLLSDASYDSEVAGWGFGVELTSHTVQSASIQFNQVRVQNAAGGTNITPTGITFPDSSVQSTAAVAGVTRDKALANAIAASMWYTWDGYDHVRTGGVVNLKVLTPNLNTQVFPDVGITDGTDFVSGFPATVTSPALYVGGNWLVVVNAETSDFIINYQVV